MPILPASMAYSPKGSVFPGPVVGAPVVITLGPLTLSTTTTGQAFMAFRAPFDMRLMSIGYGFAAVSGTLTATLYKHATAIQTSGATTLKAIGSIATIGSVEGSSLTNRDISKGEWVFLDPLAQTSVTALVVTITAVALGYPLDDMGAV